MTTTLAQGADFFARHRETLDRARDAIRTRAYYSAYPESPSGKIYGETAADDGKAAFEARLGKPFALDQPGAGAPLATERSPYGIDMGVKYPAPGVDALIAAAGAAGEGGARPRSRPGSGSRSKRWPV